MDGGEDEGKVLVPEAGGAGAEVRGAGVWCMASGSYEYHVDECDSGRHVSLCRTWQAEKVVGVMMVVVL